MYCTVRKRDMNFPIIKYELHDSLIYQAKNGLRNEIMLKISLYEIYYRDHPDIEIRFGGILNLYKCKTFVEELNKELLADEEFAWRIEAFQYDTKKQSKPNDMYFYLKTEYSDGIRIHCSKFGIKEINK